MKRTLKSLSMALIVGTLSLGSCFAAAQVGITIDGADVLFTDVKPFIDTNSRTMIPVRAVSEFLGGAVSWDDKTRTVTIEREGKTVKLVIGKKGITVDGVGQLMDTSAQISNSRTYVPLRFIGEAFDMNVEWDSDKQMAMISTKVKPVEKTEVKNGNSFDTLPTRPVTATEATAFKMGGFIPKEVAEVKQSMFPVNLEYSTVEGVYKSTKDSLIIVKLSSNGYPDGKRYGTLSHMIRIYLKNGNSHRIDVMHLDSNAVPLYPALSKYGTCATEQNQIATGYAEWLNPFFTTNLWINNDMQDIKLSDIDRIAIWDRQSGHYENEGNVIIIPMSEIPEA